MKKPNKSIDTSFIWDFQLGDNIVFNTKILRSLYKNLDITKLDQAEAITIKPIVVIGVSTIEALMFDFVCRVKESSVGPNNLNMEKIKSIAKLNTDGTSWKFKEAINRLQHHQILGNQSNYYDNLDFLRNLRNRIHIQNEFGGRREEFVWTLQILHRFEACIEYTLLYLSENYSRDKKFVENAAISWERHFPDNKKFAWKDIHLPTDS